jgi:CRP/FNR family cyclic AMP-dependent transcriptional regulator
MDETTLRTIPLFARIPRRQRRHVASWVDEVQVPAGKTLTKEGEYAREFFVIIAGDAELQRSGQRLAGLGAGDFFGDAGMLGSARTHAETVVTTSSTRLLVMGRREFAAMMWRFPAVAERIRRQAATRAARRAALDQLSKRGGVHAAASRP